MEHEDCLPMPVAPSHCYVALHYDWRFGWTVRVSSPTTADQQPSVAAYGPLSAAEALDVASSELARLLVIQLEED